MIRPRPRGRGRRHRRRRRTAAALGTADASRRATPRPPAPPTARRPTRRSTRNNVDTAVAGRSFTSVGEVFAGEQNIVTSGYGALDAQAGRGRRHAAGLPHGREPRRLDEGHGLRCGAGIVFPNATTITDVDGDGDGDIIVPSGHFFDTDPGVATHSTRGARISWWRTKAPGAVRAPRRGHRAGRLLPRRPVRRRRRRRHQGHRQRRRGGGDLATRPTTSSRPSSSAARPTSPSRPRSRSPTSAAASRSSHDVDGDNDLDIITARVLRPLRGAPATAPTFLWLENSDQDGNLTAADFTLHTIATLARRPARVARLPDPAGRGVPEPGKVSWIATNHVNRCTFGVFPPIREQVIEFVPGADIRARGSSTPCPTRHPGGAVPGQLRHQPRQLPDVERRRSLPARPRPGSSRRVRLGDVDGDGDVDLAVSGDGDRRLWWIENGGRRHQAAPADRRGRVLRSVRRRRGRGLQR